MKAINAKDNPVPDCTTSSNTPLEAKVLLTSTAQYDREMFSNDPTERPKATYTNTSSPCSLQTPEQLIEQPQITEEDIATIQNTANAFLNKITRLRQQSKLNPEAAPFNPSVFNTKAKTQKSFVGKLTSHKYTTSSQMVNKSTIRLKMPYTTNKGAIDVTRKPKEPKATGID